MNNLKYIAILLLVLSPFLKAEVIYKIPVVSFDIEKEEVAKEYLEKFDRFVRNKSLNLTTKLEHNDKYIEVVVCCIKDENNAKRILDIIKEDFKDAYLKEEQIEKSIKELHKEAVALLESKQPSTAFALLENEYKKGNFENQTLFLLGTSAKESGDLDSAIKYFEELLENDTNAHRIRLDLATIYYEKKNFKKANELFLIVRASDIPKTVRDNIDAFLETAKKKMLKNWNIFVSVGYLYDSNANAGPKTDTVLMYDLPFNLSDDAKQNQDNAILYAFGFNHMKLFYESVLQSSINYRATDYNKLNDFDTQSIAVSIGPAWSKDEYLYSIPLVLNAIKVGHQDRYYFVSKGIVPQIRYKAAQDLFVSAYLGLQEKKYYINTTKNSNSVTLTYDIKSFITRTDFISFGGYIGKEISQTNTNSNGSEGFNFKYYKSLSGKLNFYINSSVSITDYDGVEIAYGKNRQDNNIGINGSFSYFIDKFKTNATLSLMYQKNSSNIAIYEYDKEQIMLSFSKSF